jgi:zinc protease
MRRFLLLAVVLASVLSHAQAQPAKKFFPYTIHQRTLPNGLVVMVVPTPEFKDMVTFATPVFAGSRNETEKGKTGLAHLFEHIMFRHEYGGQPGGYDEMIRRMGSFNNAFTSEDLTFYHPTTFTSNLRGPIQRPGGPVPGLIELEASRFTGLKLEQKTFQVEAGAVLGEYRRIFSFPGLKMAEVLLPKAFPTHPYGHTVIGDFEDVKNMPQAWDAAWEFFNNYYRPNNVALVVVGDVDPQAIFSDVEKYYGAWKPGKIPDIPDPTPPPGEKKIHVDWEADVSPRLSVGYYSPPMDPGSKDTAVIQILQELLTSRSAPLFQKLRYQKQTVNSLGIGSDGENRDANLFMLDAELILDRFRKEGDPYVNGVRTDIIAGMDDLKGFSKSPDAAKTLEVVKSRIRNDFLAALNSTPNIARILGVYYQYNRDPNVLDTLMAAIDGLAPADVDAFAQKYFVPDRRLSATLWKKSGAAAAAKEGR